MSFNPLTVGPKHGDLTVSSLTAGVLSASASVELKGEGAGPWVSVDPKHIYFEPVEVGAGASAAQAITVETRDQWI